MCRDYRQWLEDILESCGKILRFTAQMSSGRHYPEQDQRASRRSEAEYGEWESGAPRMNTSLAKIHRLRAWIAATIRRAMKIDFPLRVLCASAIDKLCSSIRFVQDG